MKKTETEIEGAYVLNWPLKEDDRGSFRRVYDEEELAEIGLGFCPLQWSISYNKLKGTFRGIHFQWPPHLETKLVSLVAGSILDVLVDLRPDSQTVGKAIQIELSAGDGKTMYVPPGVAHGFLTSTDETTLLYGISPVFTPEASHGVRWSDPALELQWPYEPSTISDRDRNWPEIESVLEQMKVLYP